jgi:hypothetical protein
MSAQNFPDVGAPFTDPKTGRITPVWLPLVLSLFNRSGAISGVIPGSTDGANALLLDNGFVSHPDAALLARIAALEELVASNSASQQNADLRARITALEQTIAGLQPPPPISGTVLVIGKS